MGKPSRDKGKRGERELAAALAKYLPGIHCRRGQQYSGIGGADVVGITGVHIECKRTEKLNLRTAMNQAQADCPPHQVPIVCHRANGQPWRVTVDLADLRELVAAMAYALDISNQRAGAVLDEMCLRVQEEQD